MLYITTRDRNNVQTAYRTLHEQRGSDGGFFVPFQMPCMDRDAINALKENSFGQNVADVLNLLFGSRLDGADVEICIGCFPSRLVSMSHRIMFAEAWHNPDRDFARIVRNLNGRLLGAEDSAEAPTEWAWMAVRIAFLFGVFGELAWVNMVDYDHPVDVAVPSGDFTLPMAVWYARELGLPVRNIICGCNDNGGVWDLLHHGELDTDGQPQQTATPEGDHVVPEGLERLIFATLGTEELEKFHEACNTGRPYRPAKILFEELRRGMYAGVISEGRMDSIIRSVYHTSTYIMDPYSALAYSSLQDYRTRYSENGNAVVLCERSPIRFAETVSQSLGITPKELSERLNMD